METSTILCLFLANELETGHTNTFGETAPILPMLTANAAAVDAIERAQNSFGDSRDAILSVITEADWKIVSPPHAFKSQIILARKQIVSCANNLRRRLLEHGVAATVYEDGLVRFAVPFGDFSDFDRRRLHSALLAVG